MARTNAAWAQQYGGDEMASETRIHAVVDGDDAPAYDVVTLMDEDAVIYAAGDGAEIGAMVQYDVQVDDPALVEALHVALRDRPRR